MARAPILAAGGIVTQRDARRCSRWVRLRKGNEWVLPKGKLDTGRNPARRRRTREVLEETGHRVSVHEFLGTLAYEAGGRSKGWCITWRMQADREPTRALMHDVKAVAWLPLDEAVERLSRGYERAFLAEVGPLALKAGAMHVGDARDAAAMNIAEADSPALAPEPFAREYPISTRTMDRGKTLLERAQLWLRGKA